MLAHRTLQAAAALLFASACAAPSLSGFEPSDRAPLDERLLGEWSDPKEADSPTFVISRGEDERTYDVLVRDYPKGTDQQLALSVCGVLVGEHLILDLTLAPEERDALDKYGTLVLATHVFYRADFQDDGLHLHQIEWSWLGGVAGLTRVGEEFSMMPADPAGLREVLETALEDPEAWTEVALLQRAP